MKYALRIINIIIFLCLINTAFSQNDPKVDSILNIINTTTNDTTKIKELYGLCWLLRYTDLNKAVEYGEQAINLSKKIQYKPGLAESYKSMGGVYYVNSNYSQSYDYYVKSVDLFVELNDTLNLSKVKHNIGSIFSQQADYESALKYFYESLKFKEFLKDDKGIAATYNAIGLVFVEQGENFYKDAEEYFTKAMDIYIKFDDKAGIAKSYYRIGSVKNTYRNPNRQEAKEFLFKYLEISTELKDETSIAQANGSIGSIYLRLEQLDSAFIFLNKSTETWKKLNSPFEIANNYTYMAEYYILKSEYDKSIGLLQQALKIAEQISSLALKREVYSIYVDVYTAKGDYQSALQYNRRYYEAIDSLRKNDLADKVSKLELQKDFEKQLIERELAQKAEEQKQEIENQAREKRQLIISVFFLIAFVFVIIIALLIYRNNKQQHKANILLKAQHDEIVEKNGILNQKNEEIEAQKDEIEIQLKRVTKLKEEVEVQRQHVMDSIIYAKRIQEAILPPVEIINNALPQNFIIFRPRDVVSGDFYWFAKKEHLSIITVADCTGHGVPGAFMSMLGISFLNEIVNTMTIEETTAGNILTRLRHNVKTALRQTGKENEAKDGMDIAMCVIDATNQKLHYAGANNPLVFIRNNELTHYKADKMPIGIHIKEAAEFTNNEIEIQIGDVFYIFSDGFVDQFGGPKGNKFMIKSFKERLVEINNLQMEEQRNKLIQLFLAWLNPEGEKKYEQIDDVCVIGIRIHEL